MDNRYNPDSFYPSPNPEDYFNLPKRSMRNWEIAQNVGIPMALCFTVGSFVSGLVFYSRGGARNKKMADKFLWGRIIGQAGVVSAALFAAKNKPVPRIAEW